MFGKIKLINLDNIPKGDYCYGITSVDNQTGKLTIQCCPYWKPHDNKFTQESGECTAFGIKDWKHGTLIWDSVKECSVNKKCCEGELLNV